MNTMFGLHTAFAFELVAAVTATFLVLMAATRSGVIKVLGTWVGSLALAFSVLSMLCTAYYGIAYWNEGVFAPKTVAAQQMHGAMMGGMQKMHESMMGSMMGSMMKASSEAGSDAQDHTEHHPEKSDQPAPAH